jgi:hypothetical protein
MNTDYDNSKLSQDDMIIKILEFVCKNKQIHYIYPADIKAKLFPDDYSGLY